MKCQFLRLQLGSSVSRMQNQHCISFNLLNCKVLERFTLSKRFLTFNKSSPKRRPIHFFHPPLCWVMVYYCKILYPKILQNCNSMEGKHLMHSLYIQDDETQNWIIPPLLNQNIKNVKKAPFPT